MLLPSSVSLLVAYSVPFSSPLAAIHLNDIFRSRSFPWSCCRSPFSCSSVTRSLSFPELASWMSCISICSANWGFTILTFVSRARASGVRICLNRVSFCAWASAICWSLACSLSACSRSCASFRWRIASSSSSLIAPFHPA